MHFNRTTSRCCPVMLWICVCMPTLLCAADPLQSHWCWQPIKSGISVLNGDASEGQTNSVDAFVRQKLADAGLTMSGGRPTHADPPADIRLLCLPPTPEEVDAFVNDVSSESYEKLVDQC